MSRTDENRGRGRERERGTVDALAPVRQFGLAILIALWAASGPAHADRGRIAPEPATGVAEKSVVTADRFMVAAANPYAVKAGVEILETGGSAVDAAIAVQMVLNLVEPQSSGIGGGAFLVHYDAVSRSIVTYDGRETAPAAAEPDRFLKPDGRPMAYFDAVKSELSVGVPGVVAMLAKAHEKHGRLAWADLFQPAIRLARDGFVVSRRLTLSLMWFGAERFSPQARAYFFPGGSAAATGQTLKNPAFADTLETIAREGPRAFYEGDVAQSIVAAVNGAKTTLGDMTLSDLSNYEAIVRAPVCVAYRIYRICGMGPPSSGGITVAQALKLVEGIPAYETGERANRITGMHLIAEAQKLAYADRNAYLADPAFTAIPEGLLDPGYLAERRTLIDTDHAMRAAPPAGTPPGVAGPAGRDTSDGRPGTSHISIVDADGHAVSMTTTIEGAFGSGLWAAGFLLNNELTDFSFRPADAEGRPIANRVEGGKRPRSSMAPTVVMNADGSLRAVLGSPGGSRIILYVTKALAGLLDWGLDAQDAADLVNFGSRGRTFELEAGGAATALSLRLAGLGHEVRPDVMVSGLHIIQVRDGRLEGGADPRREGVAMGQ